MTNVLRSMLLTIALAFGTAATTACGDAVGAFCDRADECNFLDGQSADECTEKFHKSLEDKSDSEAEDIEEEMSQCTERATCDGFWSCINGD